MAFVGAARVVGGRDSQVSGRHASRCQQRPAVTMMASSDTTSRRSVLGLIGLASMSTALQTAWAEGPAAAEKAVMPATTNLGGNYPVDAKNVLDNMAAATGFAKGTPGMSTAVASVRQQMNDFVARYRRNDKVSGSASFNTLYTAINTLSGHYASYGNNYPVPEKRRKRLQQQFAEIDKALARGR